MRACRVAYKVDSRDVCSPAVSGSIKFATASRARPGSFSFACLLVSDHSKLGQKGGRDQGPSLVMRSGDGSIALDVDQAGRGVLSELSFSYPLKLMAPRMSASDGQLSPGLVPVYMLTYGKVHVCEVSRIIIRLGFAKNLRRIALHIGLWGHADRVL